MRAEVRTPRGFLLGVGLIAAGFALYWGGFSSPPLWDDHSFVFGQAFLAQPRNLAHVLNPRYLIEVLPARNSARPAWLASVLLDRALFGEEIAAWRAASALWHAAGAMLLSALCWELTADAAATAAAGLLFVTHPLHAETVNVITFRADPMAFAFAALALLLHARAWRSSHPLALRAASLGAFALALLSKEAAVAAPLLLPLVDALLPEARRRRVGERLRVYAAFVVLLLAYAYFRVPRSGYVTREGEDAFSALYARAPSLFAPVSQPSRELPAMLPGEDRRQDPPPWSRDLAVPGTRLKTMIAVHGSSLRRLWWPHPLQGDYAPRPALSWADPRVLAALAGWSLLAAAAACAALGGQTLLAAALAWIPASLAPVSGLVMMNNLTADRYLYFASAGVCLALASLVAAPPTGGPRARRAAAALCLAVAAVWAVLGLTRARVFRNDWLYFASTVEVDPDVPRARYNLGLVQWSAGRVIEADRNFAAAVRLWPQSLRVRQTYAAFLRSQGRLGEASRVLAEAP